MQLSKNRLYFLKKNVFLILLFAFIYNSLPQNSFNKPLNFYDSIYFSTITHTTLGYGDFYPESKLAKFLCGLQSFSIFFLITEEFVR